ncbi:hypothetical protein LguiA_003947 [Lonicera macranthoides]
MNSKVNKSTPQNEENFNTNLIELPVKPWKSGVILYARNSGLIFLIVVIKLDLFQ